MNIEAWKQKKKELKLTHDELAKISGVSRRTIAGIFSGDDRYSSPTLNTAQAIERALGIDTRPQWTDTDKELGVGDPPVPLSEEEKLLILLYRQIPSEGKDAVSRLIKSYLS